MRPSAAMAVDPYKKLQDLLAMATQPTPTNAEEARNAAVRVCELLVKNPGMIAAPRTGATSAPARPSTSTASAVHPDAEHLRAWRAHKHELGLVEKDAPVDTLCADCGRRIAKGEPAVLRSKVDLATHAGCATWWWNYQRPADEPDDSIPF